MKRFLLLSSFVGLVGCLAVVGDVEVNSSACVDGKGATVKAETPCSEAAEGKTFTAGVGICRAGTWKCQPSGKAVCVGSIGPLAAENCVTRDIDEDCNGEPLNGCDCTPGEKVACGSKLTNPALKGKCQAGIQTCGADGKWGGCDGAIEPKTRDCNSAEDLDCNGEPDRTEALCDCNDAVGHAPQGGSGDCNDPTKKGVCATGTATCGVDSADTSKGKFGTCAASPKAPGEKNCLNGLDNDCNGMLDKDEPECAKMCRSGAVNVAPTQAFTAKVFGCAGKVTYPNRNTICAPTCTACTAQQWVDVNKKPLHNYWTADQLGYLQDSVGGGDGFRCSVGLPGYGSPCSSVDSPMRVCADQVISPTCVDPGCTFSTDPEGNSCNYANCGFKDNARNDHFGGCDGNLTAGTLCCCP